MYQVIVGNIGTVYEGNNQHTARMKYGAYVRLSKEMRSRASCESVTLFFNDDIEREYVGLVDRVWDK